MKKIFAIMLLMLPMAGFTACDSEDDAPQATVNADIVGVTRVGDSLYCVAATPIEVRSVNVVVDESSADAAVGSVTYYWDGYRIGVAVAPPFGMTVDTADIPSGSHLLQMEMPVYAVGYPISAAVVSYKVTIVDDESDIPQSPDAQANPTVSGTARTVN